MWDWGIALGVAGLFAFDLIPVGVGFAVPSSPRLSKGCFLLSAALLTATTFGVLWYYPEGGPIMRIVVSAVVGALIFGGTAGALNWVDRQQGSTKAEGGFFGGHGGNATAEDGGKARGGNGGAACDRGHGGSGGDAMARGPDSFALGGEGGEGACSDRPSHGGRGPLDVLNDPRRDMIVPGTNTRLGDFGRGGDSAAPPKKD